MKRLLRHMLTSLARGGGVSAPLNATNDRIVWDGDSIIAHGYVGVTNYAGNGSWGPSTWAMALSGAKLFQPISGNVGVGGDTTALMYARRAATAAKLPKVVGVICGTNDCNSGVAAVTIGQNLANYAAYMLANGARYVVISTILPRFAPNALSGANETIRLAANALIRAMASSRIKIVDCETLGLLTGDFGDGLHPTTAGAFKIGQLFATTLSAITVTDDAIASWTNAYSPNVDMTGTSGSLNGGATGVVANNYTLDNTQSGGATLVGSKGTLAANGNTAQVMTVSGTYTGDSKFAYLSNFIPSTLVAADVLEMIAEVEISGLTNVVRVHTFISIYDAGFATLLQQEAIYSGDQLSHPTTVAYQTIRTAAWPIQAGTPAWQSFGVMVSFKDGGSGTAVGATVKIGRNRARKVPVSA
jgi:lysophospholipase L1-like esterase